MQTFDKKDGDNQSSIVKKAMMFLLWAAYFGVSGIFFITFLLYGFYDEAAEKLFGLMYKASFAVVLLPVVFKKYAKWLVAVSFIWMGLIFYVCEKYGYWVD